MSAYARAARRISGGRIRTVLVCAGPAVSCDFDDIIPLRACDYHRFRSKRAFCRTRDQILQRLLRICASSPQPHCIAAHNLTLGKNPALSAAFTSLAGRLHRESHEVSFFSIVHDLAEDGRTSAMAHMDSLARIGVQARDAAYGVGAPIRFVAINEGTRTHLQAGGVPAALLPNPVEGPDRSVARGKIDRRKIASALMNLAQASGTRFDPSRPTLLYPVRIIRRKNVAEAIIVACLFCRANLVLGSSGTASEDRRLYAELRKTAVQSGLRVVFDFQNLPLEPSEASRDRNPVPLLMQFAEAVITTSVTEGFGYALYEPWHNGSFVLGRRPAGFHPAGGVNLSHLYDRLPVPAEWIDLERLADRYRAKQRILLGAGHGTRVYSRYSRRIVDKLTDTGMVDFGMLDVDTQLSVLRRLTRMRSMNHESLTRARDAVFGQWKLLCEPAGGYLRRRNRRAVRTGLGPRQFDKRFRALLADTASIMPVDKKRLDQIRFRLVSCEYLRLLAG
jgi:hypothetical protein